MREACAYWQIRPELILAIEAAFGPPIDSYVNGAQVWLEDDIEYRLHPVSGFQLPSGISHHDLWDEVTAPTSALSANSFWDAFEAIPLEQGADPANLARHVGDRLNLEPDRYGLIDRERINEEWAAAQGAISIGARVLAQLAE